MTNRTQCCAIVAGWLLACSQDVDTGRRCEPDGTSCPASPRPSAGAAGHTAGNAVSGSGGSSQGAVGSNDSALSVHVEDIQKMTIEIVTLACAGDCADIEAVAVGGNPPYTFAWEDGSKTAKRHVCLDHTTLLRVSTMDTAVGSDEFAYEAQTAHADVTAEVLECSDPGVADAGPEHNGDLCIDNPSFEGTVTPTQFEAFDAPPWNACYTGGGLTYSAIANATLWPMQNWTFPAASDGATYLALGQQLVFTGRASQMLCQPIAAGSSHSFLVDLARAPTTDGVESTDQVLQVLGGSECAEDEVLWTSPQLTFGWTTYCVTLRPENDMTSLGFRALAADGSLMEGLVDHIVPVAECPDADAK